MKNLHKYIKNENLKEILQSLTILFNLLYRYYHVDTLISKKTTVKQFLVSYLFVGFPEISLNNKISEREKDMYIYSKEMHNKLNTLLTNMNNENLRKWIKSLNQYNNVLMIFMYEDKIKKVNEISTYIIILLFSSISTFVGNCGMHLTIISELSSFLSKYFNGFLPSSLKSQYSFKDTLCFHLLISLGFLT